MHHSNLQTKCRYPSGDPRRIPLFNIARVEHARAHLRSKECILSQSIRKSVLLIMAVASIAGCAGQAVNPMEEARGELREIKQAQEALTMGQSDEAEKLFMRALARSTRNAAEAAYQLGQLAHEHMDYEGADRYYRQAVNLQLDNPLY